VLAQLAALLLDVSFLNFSRKEMVGYAQCSGGSQTGQEHLLFGKLWKALEGLCSCKHACVFHVTGDIVDCIYRVSEDLRLLIVQRTATLLR
jgi:hypothetical protein